MKLTQLAGREINYFDGFKALELERFIQSISNIAAYNNIDFADYLAVQRQVVELIKKSEQTESVDSLKQLCDKYDWAIEPLSVLSATVIAVE